MWKNANFILIIDAGNEIIENSTGLKCANSQKIILNTLSIIAEIKNNKVFDQLIIDVKPINEKLF
ncbi:phosphoheptose isomerase family protein [Mycoplasmopsis cricetuli]|uniref:hypothetical protein n=1 Tax=Mycoplasmopsis cricetuli TaxID=171283 RepID=UPI0004720BE3|nr:hypothetical protein [Mycoplasmopsis cricetuli]